MSAKILAALRQLDTGNDNHWTADGLPRLDTVKMLAGDPTLTRDMVSHAASGFLRTSPTLEQPAAPVPGKAPETAPSAPAAPQAGASATEQPAAPSGPENGPPAAEQATQELSHAAPATETPRESAQRRYDALQREKAEVDREFEAASKALDMAIEAEAVSNASASALVSAVSHYHARQQQIAAERIVKRELLAGVDIKALLPTRAAIDEALGRRNSSRAHQRPVVPSK